MRVFPLLAALMILVGCGATPAAEKQANAITDCGGRESQFTAPPERVVALTTSVLEMLFWLGVGDRIVGIGTPPKPGTMPTEFDAAIQKLPKLAGEYSPGAYKPVPREQLLAADPDFVVGGFASNFEADGATSQAELGESGVNSYLALSTSCASAASKPITGFDLVYQDLRNLGRVFGVNDRAEQLISTMTSTAARKTPASGSLSIFPFEYDEGTQTPYAAGNRQAVNAVITQAGARNIFADIDKAYQKVSWEQVADRNPDAILIIIYDTGNPSKNDERFAEAEKFILEFAPLAGTNAVKNKRFIRTLYEQSSNGGVRNADATAALARALYP